ncbi:unnamed protein product [Effrenium voratum]|uniref:Uncharacterized protein n=1 Tax=Effrenium voratum TaxID=2562239 RepID=A0AA36MKI5_9DINO|nr:unnamed protein product [Effrenium voratum]CAJ1416483.1 unnamed protein product [Effrenium voratum]
MHSQRAWARSSGMATYGEALSAHTEELRRKARDERQKQERVKQEIEAVEDEAAQLRREALELQLEAEQQRQDCLSLSEAKLDVGALRKQVARRKQQVLTLTEELEQKQVDTQYLLDKTLVETRKVTSAHALHMEQQWSSKLQEDVQRLRDAEARIQQLQEDLSAFKAEIARAPGRAGAVQLLAVLDQLRRQQDAELQHWEAEQAAKELLELRDRRLSEKDELLASLEFETRRKAASLVPDEEEERKEEEELRSRIARNRRRAERAERDFEKLKALAKQEEAAKVHSTLPPLSQVRSAGEFTVVGALKALDQLGAERFGLLRPG